MGNYDDYIEKSGIDPYNTVLKKRDTNKLDLKQEGKTTDTSVKPKSTKLKMSYNEQREFEHIDEDIAALEEKIEKLERDIASNATNFVKLNELTKEKEEAESLLSEKMDRWVYLNDLNDKINNG